MKNLQDRKWRRMIWKGMLLPVGMFLLVTVLLVSGIHYVGRMNRTQNLDLLRQTVTRTTVQCYAVEGIYPPDVEYMEEHYNLTYDHDRYFIFYDCFASNIMPAIEVYEKE